MISRVDEYFDNLDEERANSMMQSLMRAEPGSAGVADDSAIDGALDEDDPWNCATGRIIKGHYGHLWKLRRRRKRIMFAIAASVVTLPLVVLGAIWLWPTPGADADAVVYGPWSLGELKPGEEFDLLSRPGRAVKGDHVRKPEDLRVGFEENRFVSIAYPGPAFLTLGDAPDTAWTLKATIRSEHRWARPGGIFFGLRNTDDGVECWAIQFQRLRQSILKVDLVKYSLHNSAPFCESSALPGQIVSIPTLAEDPNMSVRCKVGDSRIVVTLGKQQVKFITGSKIASSGEFGIFTVSGRVEASAALFTNQ